MLSLRQSVVLLFCVLPGALGLGLLGCRGDATSPQFEETPRPVINKQPVNFAKHTFDPAAPPSDMPALAPSENAACDSNFQSSASVSGQSRQTDAAHAMVRVTQIKVMLQLNITIWVPTDVSAHVLEHEEGHRQISEYYYQSADKIAERIAAKYLGRRVDVAGTDLNGESNKMLEQMAREITAEYNRELNPEPAQLLYDDITDHSRNEAVAKDAVAHALKNVAVEAAPPAGRD
jgi:hypothetical protein